MPGVRGTVLWWVTKDKELEGGNSVAPSSLNRAFSVIAFGDVSRVSVSVRVREGGLDGEEEKRKVSSLPPSHVLAAFVRVKCQRRCLRGRLQFSCREDVYCPIGTPLDLMRVSFLHLLALLRKQEQGLGGGGAEVTFNSGCPLQRGGGQEGCRDGGDSAQANFVLDLVKVF